ncbi:MAG: NAD-dependent epimerase/dehydratase family protein [Rhodopirellula sp.]|nr:NAD-dependent epimerase/dehydratase family protein [Rhodopirellula sp.]
MRYLVTGGAGFIGSHLSEALLRADHEVVILDDFSTGRHQNIHHLEENPKLKVIYASVLEQDVTRDCVREADRVFHLASAVGVQLIIDEPVKTIETIVEGTATLLAAAARYRKPVLLTSTSEVYGKSKTMPLAEDADTVIGAPKFRRWSYAASKALDEFLALAHWHHSRLPVVIVRLFNTVGPRQTGRYGMVIPRLVRQALAGEPLGVYGDGTQSRCFCHVHDAVGALIRLMDEPAARGEVINVGNGREVSINELAELIRSLAASPSEIRHISYQEAYGSGFEDMPRRVPDLTKIHNLIGYRPRRTLEETLRDVIEHEKVARG